MVKMKTWQEMYPKVAEIYPKITVELWNNGQLGAKSYWEDIAIKIKSHLPQRLQVAWPELGSMYELMLVPLDDEWDSLRMTGTDRRYTFVGIVNKGCYAFRLDSFTEAGYIKEKLNLPCWPEAIGMMLFFKRLSNKIEQLND